MGDMARDSGGLVNMARRSVESIKTTFSRFLGNDSTFGTNASTMSSIETASVGTGLSRSRSMVRSSNKSATTVIHHTAGRAAAQQR